MPTISVVTINYNNCKGLQRTIESVFAQTLVNFEYIVIDGGSSDGSRELIESNEKRFSSWISEKDDGIYQALNKGIKKISGEYVVFLNSGDFFLDNHFLSTVLDILNDEEADIYYGNIEMTDENNKKKSQIFPADLDLHFWEHNTLNHQACVIKSSLFNELGNYDTQFSLAADYAFFLKAFLKGKKFHYINQNIVHYNLEGISSLRNDEYIIQMKEIWNRTLPKYLANIYEENKSNQMLMKHRIMSVAKNVDNKYNQLKKYLKLK